MNILQIFVIGIFFFSSQTYANPPAGAQSSQIVTQSDATRVVEKSCSPGTSPCTYSNGDCMTSLACQDAQKKKEASNKAKIQSATADADAQRIPNTSTKIPNPLPGGICEDLLACNKISVSGMFNLKPGIQETYAYKYMIPQVIKLMLNFGAGIAVLMTVYAGMRFLTSGGDEEAKTAAIKIITYSILGILVMVLSRAIVAIVENLPLG